MLQSNRTMAHRLTAETKICQKPAPGRARAHERECLCLRADALLAAGVHLDTRTQTHPALCVATAVRGALGPAAAQGSEEVQRRGRGGRGGEGGRGTGAGCRPEEVERGGNGGGRRRGGGLRGREGGGGGESEGEQEQPEREGLPHERLSLKAGRVHPALPSGVPLAEDSAPQRRPHRGRTAWLHVGQPSSRWRTTSRVSPRVHSPFTKRSICCGAGWLWVSAGVFIGSPPSRCG